MTPIEMLLGKLADVTASGKGWTAKCPAHDDERPSLSVAEGEDGNALITCHRGCSVDEICAAVGLRVADLFVHQGKPTRAKSARPSTRKVSAKGGTEKSADHVFETCEAALQALESHCGPHSIKWEYKNKDGELVGLIIRWNLSNGKKRIRPISRYADGWRIAGMPEPRPLYRLSEFQGLQTIGVSEGEKAADVGLSMGFPFTTSPHGAKSAVKADWSPLAGKNVILFPDNDKAGKEYAQEVAVLLSRLKPTPKIKIVELPGLPEKGDLVEFVEMHGDAAADLIRKCAANTQFWSAKPLEPAESPWQPFPVDALPDVPGRFVAEASHALGCDSSMVALPLLAGLAGAIGNSRRVQVRSSWTEPCVIWTAVVASSGTMKSPAMDVALQPLHVVQNMSLQTWVEQMALYKRQKLLFHADMEIWKKNGRKSGEPPPEEPEEPVAWRIIASDATMEAVAALLELQPRGMLLARGELAGWINSFDAYKGARGADVAHWLEIHGARSVIQDRKTGRRLIYVPRAAMSVTGTVQPSILAAALKGRSSDPDKPDGEHVSNGLAARLLMAMPPRIPKQWSDATISHVTQRDIADLYDRLLGLELVANDPKALPSPVDLPLAPAALELFKAFFSTHAVETTMLLENLAAAWSKLEGYALRLALICQLAENPAAVEVGMQAMQSGIDLARWFGEEAERLYETLGLSPRLPGSADKRKRARLVEWIVRQGGRVSVRDLSRGPRKYRDAETAEAALADLVEACLGAWEFDDHGGGRGRPVQVFVLSNSSDGDTNEESAVPTPIVSPSPAPTEPESDWGEV